jgi:hypothetical protein
MPDEISAYVELAMKDRESNTTDKKTIVFLIFAAILVSSRVSTVFEAWPKIWVSSGDYVTRILKAPSVTAKSSDNGTGPRIR